jgi:hypothetical protein
MPEYVHIAGDERWHHSGRHSLYGASDVRMKIKNQFWKIECKLARKISHQKNLEAF